MNDEIIDFYMHVAHELCHGKEWCIGGVGEALRRFAELVVAADRGEPVDTIFMDQHGRQQIEFITTIPECPSCLDTYRCYWDGNDIGERINICKKCAYDYERLGAWNETGPSEKDKT